MEKLRTHIKIEAPTQLVWAVIDELELYPQWNKVLAHVTGTSTVGRALKVDLRFPGLPPQEIQPEIMRIIASREIRWVTTHPEPGKFRAEHWLLLEPHPDGGTILHNNEDFEGTDIDAAWPQLGPVIRDAYEQMNRDLKARAEALSRSDVSLHPALERVGEAATLSKELSCQCKDDPVRIELTAELHHAHLCGCSQCWKPADATLAMVGVVDRQHVQVSSGSAYLKPVDETQKVIRMACSRCGAHMYSQTLDENHHFYGVSFVHPELATGPLPNVEFAGFLSSLIGTGTYPHELKAIISALAGHGIPSYDCFSPEIMAAIEWHRVKVAKLEPVA